MTLSGAHPVPLAGAPRRYFEHAACVGVCGRPARAVRTGHHGKGLLQAAVAGILGGVSERRYKDFRREIRAFRPRDLLPAVARIGARFAETGPQGLGAALAADNIVTPWALTAVARESIVSGSDAAATQRVSHRDVRRLCAVYAELEDPVSRDGRHADLTGFFVRTGFEQFPAQMSVFEEVSRTTALYLTAAAEVPAAPLLSEDAWSVALAIPLEIFLGVGFFLHVWATRHDGWVDLNWLDRPQFEPILHSLGEVRIRGSVERYLAASFSTFRELDSRTFRGPALLEHRFNPLEARPLIKLSGRLLAPSPAMLLSRISATGIYYDRCTEPGFTDQLGPVFQHYVGTNLRLIPNATVLPEVEYARSQYTVDWIVVFNQLVMLVEVKATRLTERARAGVTEALDADIERTLVRAHRQIETTARLIRERHASLSRVPADRPIMGLTVTLEPFWLLGTALTPLPKPDGAVVPVVVASARDVEHLAACALAHDAGKLLRAVLDQGTTGTRALTSLPQGSELRNPLLDSAWERIHSWLDLVHSADDGGIVPESGPAQ